MSKSPATKSITETRDSEISAIAREHLSIETLACRNHDGLDFYDVSVWSVRAALEAAYRAGEAAEPVRRQA